MYCQYPVGAWNGILLPFIGPKCHLNILMDCICAEFGSQRISLSFDQFTGLVSCATFKFYILSFQNFHRIKIGTNRPIGSIVSHLGHMKFDASQLQAKKHHCTFSYHNKIETNLECYSSRNVPFSLFCYFSGSLIKKYDMFLYITI